MKKFLLPALAALLSLACCTKNVSPAAYINVSSVEFDKNGGVYRAVLACNSDWTYSCDDSTVVVSPSSGFGSTPITITVPENVGRTTNIIRITFTVTGEVDGSSSTKNARSVVTVDAAPFIDLTRNSITLPSEGGGARLTVQASAAWSVVDSAALASQGLTVQRLESMGIYNAVVSVEAGANTTGKSRRFDVEFKLDNYEDKVTLEVLQP